MASVTVFVDDAVLGDLPPVCVIDGVVTDDTLTYSQQLGDRSGLGVAWLLILFGPLGWLGLVVISLFRRSGELLTVTLPFSEAAYRRRVKAERTRLWAACSTVVLAVAAVAAIVQHSTQYRIVAVGSAVLACVALSSVIAEGTRVRRASVGLDLDASRRWVTLSGVHESFVCAVQSRDTGTRSHVLR
jgi:hypothetical protein